MKICDMQGIQTKIKLGDIIGHDLTGGQNAGIQIFRPAKKALDWLYFEDKNGALLAVFHEWFDRDDKEVFKERAELMAACAGYDIIPLAKDKFPKDATLTWAYEVVKFKSNSRKTKGVK